MVPVYMSLQVHLLYYVGSGKRDLVIVTYSPTFVNHTLSQSERRHDIFVNIHSTIE